MPRALVGLGTNQGDRESLLTASCTALQSLPQTRFLRCSGVIETPAVGGPPQPAYLNAAALLDSDLSPFELLHQLQGIERTLGRQRLVRWGARTIDLDLLLVEEQVVQTAELQLPHPRMVFRRFVIEPAAEVAGELRHPQLGWSLARLWQHLQAAPAVLALDVRQAGKEGETIVQATITAASQAGVSTSVQAWSDRNNRQYRPTIIVQLRRAAPSAGMPPAWVVLGAREDTPVLRLTYASLDEAVTELKAAAQGLAQAE